VKKKRVPSITYVQASISFFIPYPNLNSEEEEEKEKEEEEKPKRKRKRRNCKKKNRSLSYHGYKANKSNTFCNPSSVKVITSKVKSDLYPNWSKPTNPVNPVNVI